MNTYAISKYSITSAPGFDQTSPIMLHKLLPNSSSYFISLLDRILLSSSFPSMWKMTVVVPLLKHLKGPSLSLSYRPISLLSVLSKILETIVNRRLVWFLETNKILSHSQYGCWKGRSALMTLADLDTRIYEAEEKNSNLYSAFFDMENAFPRVWTNHICTILYQLGLCGPFPTLLQNKLFTEPHFQS